MFWLFVNVCLGQAADCNYDMVWLYSATLFWFKMFYTLQIFLKCKNVFMLNVFSCMFYRNTNISV